MLITAVARSFSDKVKSIQKLRQQKKLSKDDKELIDARCTVLMLIADNASEHVFRKVVPESEMKCWLTYAVSEMKRMATDPNWMATGDLEEYDDLATLQARKGRNNRMPSQYISLLVVRIVFSAYNIARMRFDSKWHEEKVFKKLESSGILEQFLRCATFVDDNRGLVQFLNQLQSCVNFLHKKFEKGKPCGDVLIAILEGKDGSRVKRPAVLNQLEAISRVVEAINISKKEKKTKMTKMCRHCGNSDPSDAFQDSLKSCARCKNACYCSKECQRADWKIHKTTCLPAAPKPEMKQVDNMERILSNFARKYYVLIMAKMVEACKGTDLKKKDVLIELDYTAKKHGILPAIQEPPIFAIVPIRHYIDGSRTNWFGRGHDNDPQFRQQTIAVMRDNLQKMKSWHLMVFFNFNGTTTCGKLDIERMYTDEVFDGFHSAIVDRDLGPLRRIMRPEYFEFVQGFMLLNYGIGEMGANQTERFWTKFASTK